MEWLMVVRIEEASLVMSHYDVGFGRHDDDASLRLELKFGRLTCHGWQ